MRSGKDFTDEQGQQVGGHAGVYATREAAAPPAVSAAPRSPAAGEAAKRTPVRPSMTIEEMTDRIYRRYAVN